MQFLKLVMINKLTESSISSSRVVVEVRGSINRVFSVIEVTREDRVGGVVVVDK